MPHTSQEINNFTNFAPPISGTTHTNDSAIRAASPARDPRSAELGATSTSRSSSRQRLTDAVKSVFSHGHDINFADSKGLERKSRDASRSASRNGSRSASRAASPSRLNGNDNERMGRGSQPVSGSASREASRSRLGKLLGNHGHDLHFGADDSTKAISKSNSRAGSRSGSRAPSPSRAAHGDALGSNAALR